MAAFPSRKFSAAKINYNVYDKKMAAIVGVFIQWTYMIMSVNQKILVYTDHNNVEYFNPANTLHRRQHQ